MAAINNAAKSGLCVSLANAVYAIDDASGIIFQLLYERGVYCLDFGTAEGFVAAAKRVLEAERLQDRDDVVTVYSRVASLSATLNPHRDPAQIHECVNYMLNFLLSSYWQKTVEAMRASAALDCYC